MKIRLASLSLLLLLVTFSISKSQSKEVTILYTNDIESVYEPVEAFWNKDIELIGGISYMATLVKEVQKKEKLSFLFDAGDIYTGALAQASEGRLAFDIYSHIGYDAVNIGNHEFEYGWETLNKVMQRKRFPFLNANIFYEGTDICFSQPYAIVEKDNFRIGVVGVMGVDAFKNTINKKHREGLTIREPAPIVQEYVNLIKDEVDLVIVLTHQNRTAPMQTDKEADPEVQRGFDEDFELAGKLKGVDLIIGGHSDNGLWEPVKHPETGVYIVQTFGQGKYLGYLKLSVNKDENNLVEGKLIPVESAKLKPDQKIDALIESARHSAHHLTEVVGNIDKLASRKYYRESTIGNLMADILREAAQSDIAIINSGSIRADINPGEVTVEDLINVYPFIGKFHAVEIDGNGVKDLLEHSYSLAYGYAQMSGVETRYDSRKPIGNRLIEAKINGKPLDPNKKYTVSSSAFVAYGGDDYSMLAKGKLILQSEKRKIDYFIDYFKSNKNIKTPSVGRQIDISRNNEMEKI
jgi:2',3'-cyclic-nucleotide 2'-phosphodiesterase (5'-nucleotidase family)